MSATFSADLQAALFDRLTSDAEVGALAGAHIYDAVPAGPVPDLYVLLGEETVKDVTDSSGPAALHDVSITIISTAESFLALKTLAAAITQALLGAPLTLAAGQVAAIWPQRSEARRNASGQRRIELKFKLRIEA